MKNKIINSIMTNIKKNANYSNTKLIEIRYGIEALYLSITKFVVIIAINILFKTFKEFILFTLFYSLLKITGFGLHAKKSYQCWITSIPIFCIIPVLIKNCIVDNMLIIIFSLISLLIICLYAPADTEKRPIINKKKRLIFKLLTIFTATIYILIILFVKNGYVNQMLFYSLLLESLIINPLSYKIFGLKYKNYLNYKMEGGNV